LWLLVLKLNDSVITVSSQGWVFAMAKSIFARTEEKTGKNWNIQNCTETPQFG